MTRMQTGSARWGSKSRAQQMLEQGFQLAFLNGDSNNGCFAI